MGVANKRDFYKLRELNPEDVEFIKKLAIKPSPKHLQKLHANLVKQFNFLFKLKSLIRYRGIDNQKLNDEIEEAVNNLEEDLHGRIESRAIGHINSILKGDVGFFNTDEGNMDFVYFLCVQYMRTKKIKSSVLANVTSPKNIDLEKIWNVLSHIFATNMGWSLYAERNNFHVVLLDNQSSMQFITGDQPVINTYATGDPKSPPETLEFYYPVSPVIGILVTEKGIHKGINRISVNAEEVSAYNEHIVRNAYDQIYASSEETLRRYRQLVND